MLHSITHAIIIYYLYDFVIICNYLLSIIIIYYLYVFVIIYNYLLSIIYV